MEILANIFEGCDKFGDFYWMIHQKEYDDILFIFNDNEEHHHTDRKGAGNAVIRKFNKHNHSLERPRSAGIPTGTMKYGGYLELNYHVKSVIDSAIDEIKEICKKYNYKKICYSSDEDGLLGTSIFYVNKDVLEYITKKIIELKNETDF